MFINIRNVPAVQLTKFRRFKCTEQKEKAHIKWKRTMEEDMLLKCAFVTNIDHNRVCFRICRSNENSSATVGHVFTNHWKIVLPSQHQHDTTRFKWATGYHYLDQQLKDRERNTLHCFCFTNDYYNRGFLFQPSKNDTIDKFFDNDIFDNYEIVPREGVSQLTKNGEVIGTIQSDETLEVHPAFQNRQNNSLFHCLADAVDIHLKDEKVAAAAGVSELIQIVGESQLQRKVYTPTMNTMEGPLNMADRKPFIVIEGLDGTGKSTLVDRLSREHGTEVFRTPPAVISHLRQTFDSGQIHSTLMRRVFYAIGNYITANDIKKTLLRKPAVMDRYWHSTAAYTIATECESGDECSLPPEGHWVYEWPVDLLAPDLVILLTVSEEARKQRIEHRNTAKTEEEKHLAKSIQFRQRVLGSYRRMVGPPVLEIDASGSKDEVENTVINAIQDRKLFF